MSRLELEGKQGKTAWGRGVAMFYLGKLKIVHNLSCFGLGSNAAQHVQLSRVKCTSEKCEG